MIRAYALPALAFVLTLGGLVLALVVEGLADVVALVAIAVPLVLIARALWPTRTVSKSSSPRAPQAPSESPSHDE